MTLLKSEMTCFLYIFVFFVQDSKSISPFIAYALCAADEALRDANWLPNETEKKERTVLFCFILTPDIRKWYFSFLTGCLVVKYIYIFVLPILIIIRVSPLVEG